MSGKTSLVGIKGKNEGDGKVYIKTETSKEWTVLNNGESLSPQAEDVQTVAIVNDTVFLAGTWKHGLYRSTDAGQSWLKLYSFPAKDIRAIRMVESNPNLIYATTTTKGFLKSVDLGATWTQCAADSLSQSLESWSMEISPSDPNVLFALTFGFGLKRSPDGGQTWKEVVKVDGMMFYAMAFSNSNPKKMWAVGSGETANALYYSKNGGKKWKKMSDIPDAALNQIAVIGNDDIIVIGSWDKGAFIQTDSGWEHIDEITFEAISGIHQGDIETSFFTWGNGIYKTVLLR